MNKIFLVLIFISNFCFAQNITQKTIDSKIEKVTVFLNGSQVSRVGKVILPAGKSEIIFKEISPSIDQQSIQVKAEGKVTVLSVVHQLNFLQNQQSRLDVEKLQTQAEIIIEKINIENSLKEVYEQEELILSKNQDIRSVNTVLKTIELKETVDFHRSRLTDLKMKKIELEKNKKKYTYELIKIRKQLNALNAKKEISTGEVLITVITKEPVISNLTLSYLVANAGWYPTYDLRVKDVNQPISLTYKANVYQSSGEDWNNVKLKISSGNPNQKGTKPNLSPYYLQYLSPNYNSNVISPITNDYLDKQAGQIRGKVLDGTDNTALPGVNILIKGTSIGTTSDANGFFSLNIPQGIKPILLFSFIGYVNQEIDASALSNVEIKLLTDVKSLSEVVVIGYGESNGDETERALSGKVSGIETQNKKHKDKIKKENAVYVNQKENTTSLEFEIETPYTIPNDGKVYAVEMQEYNIPALYEYYSAPKIDKDAFLTARITDWEEYNLLSGEINLFFEGTYLGNSLLDISKASDTLDFSLGRDKGVVVTRTKSKQFTKKQFIGSSKFESRNWEIKVRNTRKQPINMVLVDQIPVSTTKEIEIEKKEFKDAEYDEGTGKLTWKFKLEPTKERKFEFKYSVKYPKGNTLIIE